MAKQPDKEAARLAKIAYKRGWYVCNREKELERLRLRRKNDPVFAQSDRDYTKRRRQSYRDLLAQLKAQPCADCKERFPSECMDFDHRDPSEKTRGIAKMGSAPREVLLAEVAKCDLICACCHRIRTRRRRQGVTRTWKPNNR